MCKRRAVRGATNGSKPTLAAGQRSFFFTNSGLDVGSLATPIFYGMLIDNGMPQGVFYAIFGFTAVAVLTVLQLPGRKQMAIQRT